MSRKTLAFLAVAALAATLLSGCATQKPSLIEEGPRLSRHIAMSLDAEVAPDEMDADAFLAEHANVTFEYTHDGAPVAAADVTVRYTSATGEPVEAPLSTFSTSPTVSEGDLVRIDPGQGGSPEADVLTPMRLESGGSLLAERAGANRNWLKAAGAPIPLAFGEPGEARWSVHASGGVDLHVEGLLVTSMEQECTYPDGPGGWEPVCEERPTTNGVEDATVSFEETVDGTLRATTSLPAAGPRLAFGMDGVARAEAQVNARIVERGEPVQGTFDGWIEGELKGAEVALQFDQERELRSATSRAGVRVDGNASLTGDFGEGPDIDHPIHEETYGPETHELPAEELASDEVIRMMTRAWGLDLAVGDQLAFDMQMPGLEAESRFVSQVLALEWRDVGGTDRAAFKLSDTFTFQVDPFGGAPQSFGYDYTYWVDAETYLPIHMQGRVERTFNKQDLNSYIEAMRTLHPDEGVDIKLPDEASLTLRMESTLTLESYSGDLATSAALGGAGVRLVPLASAFFLLGGPITGGAPFRHTHAEPHMPHEPPAPGLSFAIEEPGSYRVTVSEAEPDLLWSGLAAHLSCEDGSEGTLLLNGSPVAMEHSMAQPIHPTAAVAVGDTLEASCEGAGTTAYLMVNDMETGYILAHFTLGPDVTGGARPPH